MGAFNIRAKFGSSDGGGAGNAARCDALTGVRPQQLVGDSPGAGGAADLAAAGVARGDVIVQLLESCQEALVRGEGARVLCKRARVI